jgi:hypothetical protein
VKCCLSLHSHIYIVSRDVNLNSTDGERVRQSLVIADHFTLEIRINQRTLGYALFEFLGFLECLTGNQHL